MSLQDEHPDELLQRFLLLTEQAKRLKLAEQLLGSGQAQDALTRFLDENFSLRRTPKTLAIQELEKQERDLKDEIRSVGEAMAVATVGGELDVGDENVLRQWAGRYFKTLDDLGALAELYESLSKPRRIWTGDQPWAGTASSIADPPVDYSS